MYTQICCCEALADVISLRRSVGLQLTLDDFQKVSDKVPFLADLKPSGKYVMEDVQKVCRIQIFCFYLFGTSIKCLFAQWRKMSLFLDNISFYPYRLEVHLLSFAFFWRKGF